MQNSKLKVVIAEDEPEGRKAIRQIIETTLPSLEVVAEVSTYKELDQTLGKLKPDLLLLDVELEDGTSLQLWDEGSGPEIPVVFITAYQEYAIKAFELAALDYILKPLSSERMLEAVKRLPAWQVKTELIQRIAAVQQHFTHPQDQGNTLALPTLEGFDFVPIKDIIYIKGTGNYSEVYLEGDNCLVVTRTIGYFEKWLEDYRFFRVHRSFLINLNHLKKYSKGNGGEVLLSNGKYIEVARRKKEEFLAKIAGRNHR